ncbi:MAG: T9SS type A sorting domain-containing protein [Pedobacter sp.]|nr:T9SS type A sorting domain-containing protein [Chitinophagaceae bacterium]
MGGFNKTTSTAEGPFLASYTQPALAISQFNSDKNIVIYPNPSTGNFNLTVSDDLVGAKVIVFNILGQIIKDFTLNTITTNQNLDKGMYLLEIEKEGNKTTKKLLVN